MGKPAEAPIKSKETQLVIFRLREEEFGVEINSVLEISKTLEVTHLPQAPGFIEGVVNLRGQVIPVVDLARQFGLRPQAELPKTARIVVVEISQETLGLLVDEVPEVLRIPESEIEKPPEMFHNEEKQDYVKGVAKLGERLVIVLDLAKVLASSEGMTAQKPGTGPSLRSEKGE